LHPHNDEEKHHAMNEAAREPSLFAELLGYFKRGLPSDDNLRSYLVQKGFSENALSGVIRSFRDTMQLVSTEAQAGAEVRVSTATIVSRPTPAVVQKGEPPMSIAFNGERLEVRAVLPDVEAVEKLINALNTTKALLPGRYKPIVPDADTEAAN
jgi:hypothetical protein